MGFSNVPFKFAKLTDKDVVFRIGEAAKENGFAIRTLSANWLTGGTTNVNDPLKTKDADFEGALDQNSELFRHFNFQLFTADGGSHFTCQVNRQADSPHDAAELNFSPFREEHRLLASKIIASFRKQLQAIDSQVVTERQMGDALVAQHQASEARLQRLEGISNSLIFDQEKHRQHLEGEFQDRLSDLEKEFGGRREKLEQKEKDLETRLKTIDDRESRHARRAIANTLKDTFQRRAKEFRLSKGTIGLRLPIHLFAVGLLLVLASLLVLSFLAQFKIWGLSTENYVELAIRQVLVAAAFASTSVFYFRWTNRWFERHAEEEFLLKRQEIDIDRASWVVELASEWTDRGKEIPENLMSRLTTNLFSYDSKEPDPIHPADQLASAIFGASANAKVKLPSGMGELEFDRKSHRELRRPIENQ